MNDNQFDQFVRRLNYLSRWTLATPHSSYRRSPLLPNSYTHNRLYSHQNGLVSTFRKPNQFKKFERQESSNVKETKCSRVDEDLILIEELEGSDGQEKPELSLEKHQENTSLFIKEYNSQSQIRIEEEPYQSACSSENEEIAQQQTNYAKPKPNLKPKSLYLPQSPLKRFNDRQYPVPRLVSKEIVIQDDGWEEQCLPPMNRNYTFGSDLHIQSQNNYYRKSQQSFPNQSTQFTQHQSPILLSSQKEQTERSQRKSRLQIFVQETQSENQQLPDVTSPKFNDIVTNLQQPKPISPQKLPQQRNTIKKVKISPKKQYETTSPKRKSSQSLKKSRQKKHQKKDNQQQFHVKSKALHKPKPNLRLMPQISFEIKPTLKEKPFMQSITKIEGIENYLPLKLKQTYQSIKQHLTDRQQSIASQMAKQQQQLLILRMLIQTNKMGLNVDSYLSGFYSEKQEKIILNQIKLRLAIRKLAHKQHPSSS